MDEAYARVEQHGAAAAAAQKEKAKALAEAKAWETAIKRLRPDDDGLDDSGIEGTPKNPAKKPKQDTKDDDFSPTQEKKTNGNWLGRGRGRGGRGGNGGGENVPGTSGGAQKHIYYVKNIIQK